MFKIKELYEVKCTIKDDDYYDVFKDYMVKKHIPDILKTNCFTDIYFLRDEDGSENSYTIKYFAENKANVDKYISEFAPKLREDFLQNIDTSMVKVTRRCSSCIAFSQNSSI